jgi:ssDNA-binding replication factor A large subunit
VIEKQSTRRVHSRWGNPQLISMAVISDGTDSINLPLWNTQIDLVSIGDTIQIKNGRVGVFRGEKQLNISRKLGELSVL